MRHEACLFVGVGLLILACGREAGGAICTGGSRAVGGGCYCARGQQWDGSQCAGTPETGTCTQRGAMEVISPAGSMCFCPDGWIWTDANRTECQPCGGGSFADGDRCVCPAGTAWIDNACQQPQEQPQAQAVEAPPEAPPQAQPPQAPPPVEVRQQTRQSTSNFTCCINHAKYQCPNDGAFRACMTLTPNHGCARAGGC